MGRPQLAALESLARHAVAAPHRPALLCPGGPSLTCAQIHAQIEAVRARLLEAGVGENAVVAVLAPQGLLQVLAIVGTLSHCICAPLQPRTTLAEVESALQRFGASALIVAPEFEAEARAALALGITVLQATGEPLPAAWQIQQPAFPRATRSIDPAIALLMMTSATTGQSKIVPLTIANLNAGAAARCDTLRLDASDRQLLMTSMCHIIGVENTLAQFLAGGSVIVTGGFDPAAFLAWLRDLSPTWYDCAPAVHQAALTQLESAPPQSTPLRFLQSAGAPLSAAVRDALEQLLHISVFNDYGMTEACPIAIDAFLPGGRTANSAGRACGLEIGILSASGDLLPANEIGEIVVRGPAVFPGYLDEPEINRAAFHNGWFRTGDAGRLDARGNLFITGRIKEMINRGGEKISPAEVDTVLAAHPAVLEAAAFPVPHPTLGEDVACAVVLRPGHLPPVSAAELRQFAAAHLAAFKVPRRIYFVDQIPRGELGKPQRWQLAQQFKDRGASPFIDDTVRPLAFDTEDVFYKLHEMWARLLDRDDLAFDEDFFSAGGDSLAAVNMLTEIDLRFGSHTSASAAAFVDEPTLANLTTLVGTPQAAPSALGASNQMQIFPVRHRAAPQHLFCIPANEEEGLYFRRLARHLEGQIDLSIVRPANTVHRSSLFTLERAGAEAAALLRQAQPAGPWLIAGYCYGGVVAAEAVRNLARDGQSARLVLFDVPMPGHPSLPGYMRIWLQRARRKWLQARSKSSRSPASRSHSSDHIESPLAAPSPANPQPAAGIATVGSLLARRLAWSALVPFRQLLLAVENRPAVRRLLRWAQYNALPLYRAQPIEAPILHFLCTDDIDKSENENRFGWTSITDSAGRFGWRRVARRGVEEHTVPLDHSNLLHESNLPVVVDTLLAWTGHNRTRL